MKNIQIILTSLSILAGLSIAAFASAQSATSTDFKLNDTFYNKQWYMDYINAPQAWSIATSSERQVIVAIIDGGVDDSHPDLKGALWEDPDEPIDGLDNDNDGYIDDAHGWSFVANSSNTRPNGNIYNESAWQHGTTIASLIAGRGNDDIGIAGMAWNVKIMPLVILDESGYGSTESLAEAIDYAVIHRADIINLSLEGNDLDQGVADAIGRATAQGTLVVIAAGNGYDGIGHDFNDFPLYPACHTGAANQSVLVVTGLSADGTKYPSANFGDCVNIAAPGGEIFAARPTYEPNGNYQNVSGYGSWSGTSLSAPLVSGVAAMLKAKHPLWTGEQLAKRILDTARPFTDPGLQSAGLGVGILDAGAAMQEAQTSLYGPWKLLAAKSGQKPFVYIVDESNNDLYTIQAGNFGDKRGLRAAFVRWDDDRYPEVIVSAIGDTSGAWRVYRTDGVLIAAGQVGEDDVTGGLLVSTQDLYSENRDTILLSEANGSRAWQITPDNPSAEPITVVDKPDPLGVMSVGIQRPSQAFVVLGLAENESQLATIDYWSINEGTYVETSNPKNLNMSRGLTIDNRELLRFVQSGKPSFMLEKEGTLQITDQASIWQYLQAPLGIELTSHSDSLFYDLWPR